MDRHPGGPTTILAWAGKDASKFFNDIHKGVKMLGLGFRAYRVYRVQGLGGLGLMLIYVYCQKVFSGFSMTRSGVRKS